MDLHEAISEPFVQLIDFHNAFNRSVKVSFGAMTFLSDRNKESRPAGPAVVPTGDEPWGRETRWRDLHGPLKEASAFISEMGITRAVAAFDNYLTDAKSEFYRADLKPIREKQNGAPALQRFDAILGIDAENIKNLIAMAEFFDAARNCVVHRSNCASAQLEKLRQSSDTTEAMQKWPHKRVGNWRLSLPSVVEGQFVEWQPRHAIFASEVFYRCARMLDRALVDQMGPVSMTWMAAHWCLFENPAAPCPAKLNPETMVRRQLNNRYKARTTITETIEMLKRADKWEKVRAAWNKRFPDGPDTSAARMRRAHRKQK